MKIIKKFLIGALVVFGVIIFAFLIYFFSVTANVRLRDEKLTSQSLHIELLDDKDKVLSGASAALAVASYEQLPPSLINAFLATEDRKFFSHQGFDVMRMGKALLKNVFSFSFKEGASTISQQLIKNTHLTGEKTFKRKLQELKLTAQLEKRYSKEDILKKYLNTIYFGHNLFGVCEAARFYFDCEVENLSVDQSALLAGLARSPNNYSPFKHPKKSLNRRNAVLKFMLEEGYLSKEEYTRAINAPLPDKPTVTHEENSYCQFVYNEAEKILESKGLEMGGELTIKTYMNRDLQNQLTQQLANSSTNKAGGILDNKTGGFSAYYSDVGNIKRSPASTIKPLAVYAPAFQENLIVPATPILDAQVNFNGYSPKNYDKQYHGYVSARESLVKSLNVPAAKILNSLTVKKAKKYLDLLNLSIDGNEHLAVALGSVGEGYTLQQLLSAYSTFPNQGNYREGVFIESIQRNGKVIYRHLAKEKKVFDEETAYLITDVLQETAKTGTAKKLRRLQLPIAAKTGTAGSEEKNTDAYAFAYSTGYTTGIWLGNADMSSICYTGGTLPCELLANINEYLYKNHNNAAFEDFPIPTGIRRIKLDAYYYKNRHALLLADKNSPSEYCFEELFKKTTIPRNQSTLFSSPVIHAPTIHFKNGQVTICFDDSSPDFYQYQIKKSCDGKVSNVYFGPKTKEFVDHDLSADKSYIYTVIPYYNKLAGTPVNLPAISTKAQKDIPFIPPSITKKPWWEY